VTQRANRTIQPILLNFSLIHKKLALDRHVCTRQWPITHAHYCLECSSHPTHSVAMLAIILNQHHGFNGIRYLDFSFWF